MNQQTTRCYWASHGTERERIYHDTEWGIPNHDDAHLFEMLLLEGAQAGLSWATILNKRAAFREHYDAFNPEQIACWDDKKIQQLMNEPSIIRNRLKIQSAIDNARAFLAITEQTGRFSDYIWQFVNGEPIINHWTTHADLPAYSDKSEQMAKTLRQAGFKFVGKTICYAYMQAVGMVNDHTTDCFRHIQCQN
ncbi:MAG: DNA-3-methyladenine glycosylase I [Gammaproteobacteria bacterium]|nr:DNA-3-methyladenine glycosylase I [Gammaproteobacteria bacterium]